MHDAIVTGKLQVTRDEKIVLDDLSFAIKPGRLTGLIGPSGSGKTTLIRSIVGAQQISGGKLAVLGFPAGDARLRPQIGYMAQDPAVYADLTVVQNLRYFAAILGKAGRGVERVLEQIDLQAQRNQIVETLSGGQRARVSLAVALLGDAKLLVLDEPTVGLDPLLRRQLWELFRTIAREGKTLLISSHVMDEAERCDDLLLLRDGKLLSFSAKHELLRSTVTHTVEAAFLKLIENPSSPLSKRKEPGNAS
jgi:ABC-2 type transport system ATP-binding protein